MYVDAMSQSVVLKSKDPLHIRDLLPRASKMLPPLGVDPHNIAVRHNLETTKVLRNLGYDVPSPVRVHYNWPGKHKPFDHQEIMADALTLYPRIFNLSEMGTGKTYAALWAADYLMKIGKVHKVLVLAPLSTLKPVWARDIFDILMHRKCGIVHGSMERRLEILSTDLDFYILNHDGLALPRLLKELGRRKDIDLVILDEASFFRNSRTQNYKCLSWLLENPGRRFWALTGTPTPNAPTDVWALSRLINPSAVPKFFGSFKRLTMAQVTRFKWVAKKGSDQIVYDAMQPAVRFRKRDCLSLPPVVTIPLQSRLSKQQRDAFDVMKAEMVMRLAHHQGQVTAANAADQINKLRQILCGVVKDPTTGAYVELDHRHRLKDLKEGIESANAKVLVVVPFKGIIRTLEKELGQDYSVAVLNGDVPLKARDRIIAAFKNETDPHILLCHPKVMAHGLNLTEADTLIFYAPIYSNDEYQQVIERFNRTGQKRKMTILRIAAHPLEWKIYGMVDNKAVSQDNILSLYRQVTE